MPVVNANSVDPDQMPCSAAADLGLHCLPMSHLYLWDIRHKRMNNICVLVICYVVFSMLYI